MDRDSFPIASDSAVSENHHPSFRDVIILTEVVYIRPRFKIFPELCFVRSMELIGCDFSIDELQRSKPLYFIVPGTMDISPHDCRHSAPVIKIIMMYLRCNNGM